MASIINASSTGSGGLISTGDASGVLQLQNNGTVAIQYALSSGNVQTTQSGNVAITGTDTNTYTFSVTNNASGTNYGGSGARLAFFRSSTGAAADQPGIDIGYNVAQGAGIIAGSTNGTGTPITFWTYSGSAWGERMRIGTAGSIVIGDTATNTSNRLSVVGSTSMIYIAGGNGSTNISSGTPDQMYYKITDSTVGNFFQQAFINSGGSRMFSMGAIQTSTSANFNNGKFFIEGGAVTTPATFIVDATTGYTYCGYSSSNGSYRLQVNGQIFATNSTIATSDGRYKENVQDLTGALDLVKKLRPVSFNWKKHNIHAFNTEDTTVGFIAQEVQQAMADKPYLNSFVKSNKCTSFDEVEQKECEEEFMGFAETNMVAILTKAVQELSEELNALKAKAGA
jgi:hypothetical protein